MIRDHIIRLLKERFPGQFVMAKPGVEPFVTFPAKHPGGGWRVIDPASPEKRKHREEYVWSGPRNS